MMRPEESTNLLSLYGERRLTSGQWREGRSLRLTPFTGVFDNSVSRLRAGYLPWWDTSLGT